MQISMEFSTANSLLKLRKSKKISTDITELDNCLRGGIALGKITELVGKPGTGKTQMCLQLSLNIQIPRSFGGLEGKALYLDTRRDFNPTRLKELAQSLEKRFQHKTFDFKAAKMLKNVFYVECFNAAQLLASIINISSCLSEHPEIKLIIIDSLSYVIRMLDDVFERTLLLIELHHYMHNITARHEIAFVVTNEVGHRRCRRRFLLTPHMGQKHTHLINERIWLTNDACFIGKTMDTGKKIQIQ